MSSIADYSIEDVPAVQDFNRRLLKDGVEFQFPEHAVARSPQQKFYLCKVGAEVVGGYILKTESIFIGGPGEIKVGNYQLPLSLGVIDSTYGMVGVEMLFDALQKNPFLYCLGMGGRSRPLPRILETLGWRLEDVHFFFQVIRMGRFLRNIDLLKRKRALHLSLRLLNGLGIISALNVFFLRISLFLGNLFGFHKDLETRQVSSFSEEVDELWGRVTRSGRYEALLDRKRESLIIRFPESDPRFVRLEFKQKGRLVGWALLTCSDLDGHKQFGSMRLGTLVDCLCEEGFEEKIVFASRLKLMERNVDLIVTNQSHMSWHRALKLNGFLRGPSNFTLACSPDLSTPIKRFDHTHWNRGDGDGPIHL